MLSMTIARHCTQPAVVGGPDVGNQDIAKHAMHMQPKVHGKIREWHSHLRTWQLSCHACKENLALKRPAQHNCVSTLTIHDVIVAS